MNYQEFAKKYLEDVGAFDKEGMYGGMIGDSVMKLVEAHSEEGHITSARSSVLVNEAFFDLNNAYSGTRGYATKRHKIWDDFWKSPEGMKLQADSGTPNIMNQPPQH